MNDIRVLFVDDERQVLDALRRTFRDQDAWDLEFRSSGKEALAAIAYKPFDVVVSDMNMPGMGGIELLELVRHRAPDTVRLLFSGQPDRESTLRATGPAHQYLPKPCDPARIRATIRRTVGLRRLLKSSHLARILKRIEHLPALPELYRRVVSELEKPTASSDTIARIIGDDPAMAAELLRIANSAFFGPDAQVSSVVRAVQLLGLDMVSTIVLRAGVFQAFVGSSVPRDLLTAVSEQSIRATRAARTIARLEDVDPVIADDSITAALLHDVGVLVLAANLPEYARVLSVQRAEGGPIGPHERKLIGATHGDVGGYLLGLWGLPEGTIEAVAYHESPEAVTDREQVDAVTIVAAATVIAHIYGPGPFEPDPDARIQIGFAEQWPEWEEACRAEMLDG